MKTPRRFVRRPQEPENRINDRIAVPEVRLVDEEGNAIGIVAIQDALSRAEQADLDLVEVAPNGKPPVCRIMDYKKFLYEKERKKKEARKQQRNVETKEVKLRPNIDEHDYQTKLARLRKFLQKGFKCRVVLMFRPREMRRFEVGRAVVDRLMQDVEDIAVQEPASRTQARTIIRMLSPNKELIAEAEKQHKIDLEHKKEEHERKLAEKHHHDEEKSGGGQ